MLKRSMMVAAGTLLLVAGATQAQTPTVSPAAGALPAGFTPVGGIVTDLVGLDGSRLTAQLAASSLYVGFASTNPFTIGVQGGFSASIMDMLGGGIAEAAFRFSLFDGDMAPGNFDAFDNTLRLNGSTLADWSTVTTYGTTSSGAITSGPQSSFRNNLLDTGWFYTSNAGFLSGLYSSMVASNRIVFELFDEDPGDNFYDFTQGIDASLIDVEVPVTPGTTTAPEPVTLMMLASGLVGVGAVARRRRRLGDV